MESNEVIGMIRTRWVKFQSKLLFKSIDNLEKFSEDF